MTMMSLIDTVLNFLLFSSAMLLALGVLSTFIIKVLKIQGKPKLWICTLLIIMPLAYPVKTFFPGALTVPVPLVTFQSHDAQYAETASGNHPAATGTTPNMVGEALPPGTLSMEETSFQSEASGIHFPAVNSGTHSLGGHWKAAAAALWGIIFLLFITRLGWMVKQTGRLIRLADPVTHPQVVSLFRQCVSETGLRHSPRLLKVDHLPAPMVIGLLRPAVLLPTHLLATEFREGLRFALLHELKHVQRHHNWWLLIESLVNAIYFFHPVVYWAKKRIHEEWEYLCDEHVIQVTRKSISYADFLLHEIRNQTRGMNPALALSFFSGMAKTRKRIRSILENSRPTPFSKIRGRIAVGFILLSFVFLLLCSVAPSAQEPGEVISGMDVTEVENREAYSIPAETLHQEIKTEAPDPAIEPMAGATENTLPMVNMDDSYGVAGDKKDIPEMTDGGTAPLETEDTPIATGNLPVPKVQNTSRQVHGNPPEHRTSDIDTPIRPPALGVSSEGNLLLAQNHEPTGAVSTPATAAETKAEKYLGAPEDGIYISRINETRVLDSQTILFIMRGGDLYLNRLPARCPGLNTGNGFSYNIFSSNRLTRFDRIQVLLHGNFPGSTGMLGDFIPFRYEGGRSDAIKLLKDGLLDELVAEGAFEEAPSH